MIEEENEHRILELVDEMDWDFACLSWATRHGMHEVLKWTKKIESKSRLILEIIGED